MDLLRLIAALEQEQKRVGRPSWRGVHDAYERQTEDARKQLFSVLTGESVALRDQDERTADEAIITRWGHEREIAAEAAGASERLVQRIARMAEAVEDPAKLTRLHPYWRAAFDPSSDERSALLAGWTT